MTSSSTAFNSLLLDTGRSLETEVHGQTTALISIKKEEEKYELFFTAKTDIYIYVDRAADSYSLYLSITLSLLNCCTDFN